MPRAGQRGRPGRRRSIERLAVPGPIRMTPVMTRFLERGRRRARRTTSAGVLRRLASGEPDAATADRAARRPVRPDVRARAAGPPPRHAQPGRRPRRHQVQRHPGRRRHRGRLPASCRARPSPRCAPRSSGASGRSCWPPATIELVVWGHRSSRRPRARVGHPRRRRSATTTRTPSRCRSWRRSPPTPSTSLLGVPTFGFSPLRLDPDERFLERFHGVDERVSLDALRFGPAGPLRRGPPLLRLSRSGADAPGTRPEISQRHPPADKAAPDGATGPSDESLVRRHRPRWPRDQDDHDGPLREAPALRAPVPAARPTRPARPGRHRLGQSRSRTSSRASTDELERDDVVRFVQGEPDPAPPERRRRVSPGSSGWSSAMRTRICSSQVPQIEQLAMLPVTLGVVLGGDRDAGAAARTATTTPSPCWCSSAMPRLRIRLGSTIVSDSSCRRSSLASPRSCG